MDTPTWIEAHCEANGGGWAHPVKLTRGHPALESELRCFACEDRILVGDVVISQPFLSGEDARWILHHRACLLNSIGTISDCGEPDLPADSAGLVADAVEACVDIGLYASAEVIAKIAYHHRFLRDPKNLTLALKRLGRRVGVEGSFLSFEPVVAASHAWVLMALTPPRTAKRSAYGLPLYEKLVKHFFWALPAGDDATHVEGLTLEMELRDVLVRCLAATESAPTGEPKKT